MTSLRRIAIPLGVLSAVLLLVLFNPLTAFNESLAIEEGPLRTILTVGFWASFVVLLIVLFAARSDPDADEVEIEGPRFVRFLFNNSRAGLFWLPIRLFLGVAWLEAGWHK